MDIKSIFIYGDCVLAAQKISLLKRKFPSHYVSEHNLDEEINDRIRMDVSSSGIASDGKIVILKNIPNQKAVRAFVVDICKNAIDGVLVVVWDSENTIKRDPKTMEINKTWGEFISEMESIEKCKVINTGFDFTEKESHLAVDFIQQKFKSSAFEIGTDAAMALLKTVGGNRAIIQSEIEKLILSASGKKITYEWVINNCFPIVQEPVLWKLSSAIDKLPLVDAYLVLTEYLGQGVNGNVIAEILAKKAKWQLAAFNLWHSGSYWPDVEKELLRMGKFPSDVWHSDKSQSEKKAFETEVKELDKTVVYLKRAMGLKEEYFNDLLAEDAKMKAGDCLPLPFIATQIVQLLQEKLVRPNASKYDQQKLKLILLNRSVDVYNKCLESLKNIRYGEPVEQELYLMLKSLLDYSI